MVVLIHGMGTNKDFWIAPERVRILGQSTPLKVLLESGPEDRYRGRFAVFPPVVTGIESVYHDLIREGFSVLVYSQSRPVAELDIAVQELKCILDGFKDYVARGVIFIGHSRGGLVARALLQQYRVRLLAYISIGTPHRGSRIATVGVYLSVFAKLLRPLLTDRQQDRRVLQILKSMVDLLNSRAIRELRPESQLFTQLDPRVLKSVPVLSIGGTSPTLFRLCRWHGSCKKYKIICNIPDVLSSVVSEGLLPEEILPDRGDGLVRVESAEAPYADRHKNFPLNHIALVFHRDIRRQIMEFIKGRV